MYTDEHQLYIAHSENGPINLIGKMANRHGLIAGATGTGKPSHCKSLPNRSVRRVCLVSWPT